MTKVIRRKVFEYKNRTPEDVTYCDRPTLWSKTGRGGRNGMRPNLAGERASED